MIARTSIQSLDIIEAIPEENSNFNQKPLHAHPEELVDCSDEELCRNAQRECVASREVLWHRYSDFIRRIVWTENYHQHLPQHELADALQELYFAFDRAVQRYDPENNCTGKSASFKTFLRLVVARKFSNHCALWRIYHKRIFSDYNREVSHSFSNEDEERRHFWFDHTDGNGYSPVNWQGLLMSTISSDSLADALRRLKPKERHLLEVWLQCDRDKEVARVLGISPAAAKLRRERLFSRIRQSAIRK